MFRSLRLTKIFNSQPVILNFNNAIIVQNITNACLKVSQGSHGKFADDTKVIAEEYSRDKLEDLLNDVRAAVPKL